ncbi:uncharacterized protein LOC106166724 [Lingula anatina]|uniref:Uncharacterized protein LOC106166724 n=1 Tax=Lingula anatina TaxID=7574 RepID=A0A1S3IRI5_LINAN|nr:uncharacterized protein LOC106166724 [Lingula anatina]|eukprot:XP_013400825.1 uncharacterized protein LOC106166724 [Lingula anatina]
MSCAEPGGPGMILMRRAFHGQTTPRKWPNHNFDKCHRAGSDDIKCTYCPDDCTDESKDIMVAYDWTKCTGMVNCTTYVMQASMPNCQNTYSDYLHLEYMCIPRTSVFDICANDEKWVTEGYIRTPNYPNHYGPSHACKCTLEATWGDSGVELEIYELLLERDADGECTDWMMVKNGDEKERKCGQIFNTTIRVPSRMAEIYFYSDSNDVSTQVFQYFTRTLKGFWLHFRFVGSNIKVSCGQLKTNDPTLMEMTIPPMTSESPGNSTQADEKVAKNRQDRNNNTAYGSEKPGHKDNQEKKSVPKSEENEATSKRKAANTAYPLHGSSIVSMCTIFFLIYYLEQ